MITLTKTTCHVGRCVTAVGIAGLAVVSATVSAQEIQEIVVSAQKRDESLQTVPIAITALSGDSLEAKGISRVQDIERTVPSINFGRGDRGRGDITIRGVSDFARMPALDTRASVYVDGVLLGRSQAVAQGLANIERVEVLRGPQGTLFGQGTVSGAINIITKKPRSEFSAKAELGYGNYDQLDASAFVNVPITSNLFATLDFRTNRRDGYVKNLAGGPNLNTSNIRQFRAQLLYAPVENLEIRVTADSYNDRGLLARGESPFFDSIPWTTFDDLAPADPINPNAPAGLDDLPRSSVRLKGLAMHIDYGLGDFTLQSITGYRDTGFRTFVEDDMGEDITRGIAIPPIWGFANQTSEFVTQELRLVSPKWDKFDFVAGLFYLNQENTADDGGNVEAPGLNGTQVGYVNNFSKVNVESFAVFANANYRPFEILELTVGGRWTHDRKKVNFAQDVLGLNFAFVPRDQPIIDSRSWSEFTPKVGANLYPADDVMAYFTWSKGYKSGAFQTDATPPFITVDDLWADPETVTNYELGLKTTFFDRRVRFNLAGYISKYKDYQDYAVTPSSAPGGLSTFLLTNAAEATSKGIEVDLTWQVAKFLSLSASYSYNDAKFDSYPNATATGADFSGNRLKYAPKNKIALAADTEFPVSNDWTFFGGADYSWTDKFFGLNSNSAISFVDDFWSANARAGFRLDKGDRRWDFVAWITNLTNEANIRSADNSVGPITRISYDPPRMYGVRLKFSFR